MASAFVAVAAVVVFGLLTRRSGRWRAQIRSTLADEEATANLLAAQLAQVRSDMERTGASVARLGATVEVLDSRVESLTESLAVRRIEIERITTRRLVPLGRLISAIATAGRYAFLWRKPFG